MLKGDPKYKMVFEYQGNRFYEPANIADGYHHSRYLEATHNSIYAHSGATKEVLEVLANEMLSLCNTELKQASLRTDIAAIAHNILFRLKSPVDAQCAIKQGAILSFLETDHDCENPDKVDWVWTQKKMELAARHPQIYSFFLSTGIIAIPQYRDLLTTLEDEDYYQKRETALRSMLPMRLQTLQEW